MKGVDYSYSRPDLACLKRQGVTFIARYLSDSPKGLTRSEVQEAEGLGLRVVSCYETTAGFMISGRESGNHHAHSAQYHAKRVGQPANRPIYFALDVDPRGLDNNEWLRVEEFLHGASDVLGEQNVGVYGGYDAIIRLVPIHAKWGWQTYAWSAGRQADRAHIYQYSNGINLCGGNIDYNEAWKDDYGQWSGGEDDMTEDELVAILNEQFTTRGSAVRKAIRELSALGAGDVQPAPYYFAVPTSNSSITYAVAADGQSKLRLERSSDTHVFLKDMLEMGGHNGEPSIISQAILDGIPDAHVLVPG